MLLSKEGSGFKVLLIQCVFVFIYLATSSGRDGSRNIERDSFNPKLKFLMSF